MDYVIFRINYNLFHALLRIRKINNNDTYIITVRTIRVWCVLNLLSRIRQKTQRGCVCKVLNSHWACGATTPKPSCYEGIFPQQWVAYSLYATSLIPRYNSHSNLTRQQLYSQEARARRQAATQRQRERPRRCLAWSCQLEANGTCSDPTV